MRKDVACLLAVVALVCGFLVGREFPRHQYQAIGNGFVILDTSTGKACDMRLPAPLSKDSNLPAIQPFEAPTNPVDKAFFDADKYATPSGLPRCAQ
jgi:hypothetical protein